MKTNKAEAELERLAKFIIDEVRGEPSRNEGAVDTAIRLIRTIMKEKEVRKEKQ